MTSPKNSNNEIRTSLHALNSIEIENEDKNSLSSSKIVNDSED